MLFLNKLKKLLYAINTKSQNFMNRKQKLIPLMTLLMSVSIFGSNSLSAETQDKLINSESQQKPRRFGPSIEASARKGNKRSIAELDAMVPVFESDSTLGLIDVKAKLDNHKSKEINIGAAIRHNFNDSVIFGLYTYFNHRKTGNNFSISGATIGAEALTRYLDARANFYISQDKKKKIAYNNKNQIEMKGKSIYTVLGGHTYEQGFSGYDLELGLPIFSFSEEMDKKIGTKIFAAHYQFSAKGAPKIKGTRFRIEQPLGSFDIGNNELRLGLNAETQKDNVRGRQTSVGLSAKLLFNSSKENHSFRSRMMDTIIRDVDIVTASEKAADTVGSLVDSKTGKRIDQVVYVVNNDESYLGDGTKEKPYSFAQIESMNLESSIIIPTKGQKPLTQEQYNTLTANPLALTKGKEIALTSNNPTSSGTAESADTKPVLVLDADPIKGITMKSSIAVVNADTQQSIASKKPEIKTNISLVNKIVSEESGSSNAAILIDPIEFAEEQASVGKETFVEIKSNKEFVATIVKDLGVKVEEVREVLQEIKDHEVSSGINNQGQAQQNNPQEDLADNLFEEEFGQILLEAQRAEEQRIEEIRLARIEQERIRAEEARRNRIAEEEASRASERVRREQERTAAREQAQREQAETRAREVAEEQTRARLAEEQRQRDVQGEQAEEEREIRESIGDEAQRIIARQILNNHNGRFTVQNAIILAQQIEQIRTTVIERANANPNLSIILAILNVQTEIRNRLLNQAQNNQPEPEQNVVVDNVLDQDIDFTQYIDDPNINNLSQEQINAIAQIDTEDYGNISSGVNRDELSPEDQVLYDLMSSVRNIQVDHNDDANTYNKRNENYESAKNILVTIQDDIDQIRNDPNNNQDPEFARVDINQRIAHLVDTTLISQGIDGDQATQIKHFIEKITTFKKNEVAEMARNFMLSRNTSVDITGTESMQRLSKIYGILDGDKAIDILKKILLNKINKVVQRIGNNNPINENDILGLDYNSAESYRQALTNRRADLMRQERESGFSIVNDYIAAYRRLCGLRNDNSSYTEEIDGRFNTKEALALSLFGALDAKEAKRSMVKDREMNLTPQKIFERQKSNIEAFWPQLRDMQRAYNDRAGPDELLDDGLVDQNSCAHGQCVRVSWVLAQRHKEVEVLQVKNMQLKSSFSAAFKSMVNKLEDNKKNAIVNYNKSISPDALNLSIDENTKRVVIKDNNNRELPRLYNDIFSTIINDDLKPRFRFVNDDVKRPLMNQQNALDILKYLPGDVNNNFQNQPWYRDAVRNNNN